MAKNSLFYANETPGTVFKVRSLKPLKLSEISLKKSSFFPQLFLKKHLHLKNICSKLKKLVNIALRREVAELSGNFR